MPDQNAIWCTPQGQELLRARDVGAAIRLARQRRRWRQADLAAASGYSTSTISRLETGRRPPTDLELVRRVAEAAGIPSAVLGALIGVLPARAITVMTIIKPDTEEAMRRRDLLAAAGIAVPATLLGGLDDALAILPGASARATTESSGAELARARAMFDAGATVPLIRRLPGLLATAQSAALARKEPGAYMLLSAWYDLATGALIKVGDTAVGRITADRAVAYARLSGSPAATAYAARSLSIVLRHQDRRELAERVVLDAAAEIDRDGLSTRLDTAAYAHVLCTCAYTAATAGDRPRAVEMITEAARAAARLPARPLPGYATPISPAQVTLYKIGVHWALGDPGAALHAARDLRAGELPTSERRARFHTDLARAWWQWGKPERAATELLAAHAESPAEVICRPRIRELAEAIVHRHPHVSEARHLRAALGPAGRHDTYR